MGGYVNEPKQAEFCAFGNLLRNSMLTIEPNFVNMMESLQTNIVFNNILI